MRTKTKLTKAAIRIPVICHLRRFLLCCFEEVVLCIIMIIYSAHLSLV